MNSKTRSNSLSSNPGFASLVFSNSLYIAPSCTHFFESMIFSSAWVNVLYGAGSSECTIGGISIVGDFGTNFD